MLPIKQNDRVEIGARPEGRRGA
ncbi:MAG: hypothetical protein QOC97_1722, partial [Chloroflexota bacterium]|nr:hypothetical protein [Chloroflexota bacterium]